MFQLKLRLVIFVARSYSIHKSRRETATIIAVIAVIVNIMVFICCCCVFVVIVLVVYNDRSKYRYNPPQSIMWFFSYKR